MNIAMRSSLHKLTSGWMRRRRWLAGVLLCLAMLIWLSIAVLAQEAVEFRAVVDRTRVAVGDQVTLTLSVSGGGAQVPEPSLPPLEGFEVYSSGRSQQVTIVNGAVSTSVEFSYVLIPTSEGTLTIGPAQLTVDGQSYNTAPIDIEVTAGTPPTQPPEGSGPSSSSFPSLQGQDLFVDAVVDKHEAYIGEQITLTFRLLQAVNLFEQPSYNPPSTNGFWSERMPPQVQSTHTINGRRYLVTEVRTALFPTSVGEQTIGAASLVIRDFFVANKVLSSEPLTVRVKPLPTEGQPPGFTGVVGRYQVAARLEPAEARAHEPATLYFTVQGQGNIQSVPEPAWNLPDGLRTYDTKSNAQSAHQDYVIGGQKVFEKLLVPEREGEIVVPAIGLTYFDPLDGQYHQVESEPLTLKVTPGAAEAAASSVGGSGMSPGVALDIRHIKPAPGQLEAQSDDVYRHISFWLLWLFPALSLPVAAVIQRHRRRLQEDVRYARIRRSRAMASRRLRVARRHIEKDEVEAGCAAISAALVQYVADKINRPPASLTLQEIQRVLDDRGAEEELVRRYSDCHESCDRGRFGLKAIDDAASEALLWDAEQIIVELEDLAWESM